MLVGGHGHTVAFAKIGVFGGSGRRRASTPSPGPFPLEGKGSFESDRLDDFSHHGLNVFFDASGRNAEHPETFASQPLIAGQISQGDVRQIVNAAVHLNDQFGPEAREVDDVGADRGLTTDANVELAQPLPEFALGPCRSRSKTARAFDAAGRDARPFGEALAVVGQIDHPRNPLISPSMFFTAPASKLATG